MAKFIGRLADIGIAREGTRGTGESSADFWLPKMSLTLDDGIEQSIDESSLGVIEDSPDAVVVGRFAEGEIEGNVYDRSFGLILLSALGAVSTSGPAETSVYTHTFTVGQSAQHPAMTLFLDDPNQDYTYELAMLNQLDLDVQLGQHARYTAAFRSKVGETATLSPSYTVENVFLPQHASVRIASAVAGLGAATPLEVRSVQLTVAKNIEDDRVLGSLDATDILNKQISVEGTIELVFNNNTFKTEMLADTAQAMRIRLTNTNVLIGTTLRPQITIDLARVKFGEFSKTYGSNDIVTASVSFKAFYSLAATSMIAVELVNTQANYSA
jgi:hypothetical protein